MIANPVIQFAPYLSLADPGSVRRSLHGYVFTCPQLRSIRVGIIGD